MGGSSSHHNEFSRTIQPDRVLRKRGQRSSDYSIEIEASNDELEALADRFDLEDISKLQASLSLRTYSPGQRTLSGNSDIEVEGTVTATVTQRCVRTNDLFEVEVEFPLYCIVRPATPMSGLLAMEDIDVQQPKKSTRDDNNQGKRKSNKNDSYRSIDNYIDEMDVIQLERMLQRDISSEDDVLMEDEFIYPTDGLLDVGELVSQLFWLQLDPYPKKPGTDPVQRSITG